MYCVIHNYIGTYQMSQSHISIQQLNSRGKNIAVSASDGTIGVSYAAKGIFFYPTTQMKTETLAETLHYSKIFFQC